MMALDNALISCFAFEDGAYLMVVKRRWTFNVKSANKECVFGLGRENGEEHPSGKLDSRLQSQSDGADHVGSEEIGME